jgi:ATP-dependent Lon protease
VRCLLLTSVLLWLPQEGLQLNENGGFYTASVQPLPRSVSFTKADGDTKELAKNLRQVAEEMMDMLDPSVSVLAKGNLDMKQMSVSLLADLLAAHSGIEVGTAQQVLETSDLKTRVEMVIEAVAKVREVMKVSNEISNSVKNEMSKTQREFLLRQQMKAIEKELGEQGDEDGEDELEQLQKKLEEKMEHMPEEAKISADREMKRLKKIPPSSMEHSMLLNWLEWMVDLPWGVTTDDRLDVEASMAQLDADHHGLDKVKDRIVEYLAVRQLRGDMKGPIMCLAGPPGVGKTSLGISIADSMNRKFNRISLGGVHDEAEIRGHRRTYVGAMPGVLLTGFRKAGAMNPVIMLDEIDKMGRDMRGDPGAALLEVLDPAQNSTFTDHYLGLPFDISKALWIATANDLSMIAGPLQDRMEVIELPGYTINEKCLIAEKHLIPKELAEHGLIPITEEIAAAQAKEAAQEEAEVDDDEAPVNEDEQEEPEVAEPLVLPERIVISDAIVATLCVSYTKEAGVRSLQRQVAALCRAVALDVAKKTADGTMTTEEIVITHDDVERILGPPKFDDELSARTGFPGIATGLAWTQVGGDVLFIEATKYAGRGSVHVTGNLGEVMQESAQIAVAWIRSHAVQLGLTEDFTEDPLKDTDIHIHFPAGAVPKDGPSAGVTITTCIVSLLTDRVVRPDTAMTGEISLRGQVMPVGGVKEKVLAAHRLGLRQICVPYKNRKDIIYDVPEEIQDEITWVYAETIEDILRAAFVEPIELIEDTPLASL